MAASEEQLSELHAALARALAAALRSEEPNAALLNVARQFLRDNGIESDRGNPDSPTLDLHAALAALDLEHPQ